MEKIVQIQKKNIKKTKKIAKKIEITNFNEKLLQIISKHLKLILIISTLNT
jgi:hypothetical protein